MTQAEALGDLGCDLRASFQFQPADHAEGGLERRRRVAPGLLAYTRAWAGGATDGSFPLVRGCLQVLESANYDALLGLEHRDGEEEPV
jgi:hypothetical protein